MLLKCLTEFSGRAKCRWNASPEFPERQNVFKTPRRNFRKNKNFLCDLLLLISTQKFAAIIKLFTIQKELS
jgi:hypothetical protein